MTMVAVVGSVGSPGATTTALALTLVWPLESGRRVVMVEADPDGGAVHAGALSGRELGGDYGLHNLGLAHRRGALNEYFFRQHIDLTGGRMERLVAPGIVDPAQAPALDYAWKPLAEMLTSGEIGSALDTIVDLGRSGARGPAAALAHRADVVAVVVRNTVRSVTAAKVRLAALRKDLDRHGTGADAVALIVIDQGRYSTHEVGRELEAPVLGHLPHAPKHAVVLSDGEGSAEGRFMTSPLMRAVGTAADGLQIHARTRRMRLAAPRPALPAEAPRGL